MTVEKNRVMKYRPISGRLHEHFGFKLLADGNESYFGITGHWIAGDWNLISVILECVHVAERHYSNNVAELYKQLVKDWDITKKIQALVTDNARNLVSAVNQTGFVHIPCLAHSLQLSILHGFKAADTETSFVKCQKIIRYFKHSSIHTTELQNCSDSLFRKLQQDVLTRWNSTFLMLKRSNNHLHVRRREYKGPKLFDSDWEKISKYINVLDLFCQATVQLGSEKYASCSCVLPLLLSLTKHMIVNDDDPGYITRFKVASVNNFSKCVADMKSIEILQIAKALDPRYKNLKCLSDDSQEQTWLLIGQQIAVDVNDDRLKTNAQDDTDSVSKTICEPNEKRIKLMEFDSDLEEEVENASAI
ncbi:zinc finger BED domain-containing protein 1-like [Octopus sinensis]|nr:zinc finger BED domain-containing protein 1-like [Octopus sinensis]